MNKKRLKELSGIYFKLEVLRDELGVLISAEEDALSNMPESLQDSDKGSTMQDGIDGLNNAVGYIEDAIGELDFFEIVPIKKQ